MSFLRRVVEHIFGSEFLQSCNGLEMETTQEISNTLIINSIQSQLETQILHSSQREEKRNVIENGRVGNIKVCLDLLELSNRVSSYDSFKIIGAGHFGTVKTNCGVFKGKWQYEVLLLSTGVMQIGWASFNSKFGVGQGVGDTYDSYAFDGCRVRKWNMTADDYGEKWEEDDVIGCCIDLDAGCVEFFRNGKSMGIAFKNILMGAGIVYFPTVSLQRKEGVIANFGATPFYYPVPGYSPIQQPPNNDLESVTFLLNCFHKLISMMDSRTAPDLVSADSTHSNEAVLMEIGKILTSSIVPFLSNPYIMEAKFIPFIHGLCETESQATGQGQVRPSARITTTKSTTANMVNNRKLNIFLDLLWAFSEKGDLNIWTNTFVSRLTAKFQHNLRPLVLDLIPQKEAIIVLHGVSHHKKFRQYLMRHVLFEGVKFPWLMNIIIPPIESSTFWDCEPKVEINQRAYSATVSRINSAMTALEDMQVDLVITLMDNTDGSANESSSRNIFLSKLQTLRRQFYALYRVDPLRSPGSPLFLVQPLFQRLTRVVEVLCEKETSILYPEAVPSTKFYDGSLSYYDIDRLGGVLLFLLKTFLGDLEERLGVSHSNQAENSVGTDEPQSFADSSTSTVRHNALIPAINFPNVSSRMLDVFDEIVQIETWGEHQDIPNPNVAENSPLVKEPLDVNNVLIEILDTLVLFYHISCKTQSLTENTHSQQTKVEGLAHSLQERKDEMKFYQASCPVSRQRHASVLKVLESSNKMLLDHLNKNTSHLATLQATRYPSRLSRFFRSILNTMEASADDEHLFHFVPEFYLDCLIDLLKDLNYEARQTLVSLPITPDREQLMLEAVKFVCYHIDDQRIRIARAKDALLLTLLDIVTSPILLEVLHHIPAECQMNMIKFLLQPYENRAWANSNWILVRIWHGSPSSFACDKRWSAYLKYKLRPRPLSYPINPLNLECDPYPSYVLQEKIKNLLLDEPDAATAFLNSLLNQLNWAFSEFIGMLQELQNVSDRQERVLVESRQLKICATCFDLTLALLRVLEMVCVLALPVFIRLDHPNSNFLLARLCQLICQVLSRASSQDGCFHHIITLEIPGLENVNHLPILTAVCGILLAVLKEDLEGYSDNPVTEVPRVTKTLLVEPSFQLSSFTFLLDDNPNLFSLHYYTEYIKDEEISVIGKMLKMIIHYHDACIDSNTATNSADEDEMCPICFAYPISTIITKVTDGEGKVVYDEANQLLQPARKEL
ncbi:E3 ubiquitin-protein ligase RNF123 [Frankliniella fusca]|uniref:E3 ubiquitin-protein ligase RNF123 n=1 Tax=Frankliniella fusca TaxID=407009 RepID=A0AAE1LNQ8_9NEOP|nr:E3 ubiquitin-protein ligase RNF123 [Frankliniella fusca]